MASVPSTIPAVSRAFDDALARGADLPDLARPRLPADPAPRGARGVAEAVGVERPNPDQPPQPDGRGGAHHPTRDPRNRRVHQVELTQPGEAMFQPLLGAVTASDQQLRTGLTQREPDYLSRILDQL